MSQLNITGISSQLKRFKTQIQLESIKTKEGYTGLLNDTLKQNYWDLMVAKLDVFLNQITNGSWSLSEKTVLIQKVDSFKESFSRHLNELPDDALVDSEYMSSWINRDVFCFVLKGMSTVQLSSDINFSLKSEDGARSVIQLNNANEVLAEYPLNFLIKETELPDYTIKREKYIPQELSQQLYALMLSYDSYNEWCKSYNSQITDIVNNTSDDLSDEQFIELHLFLFEKRVDSLSLKFNDILFKLQDYLTTSDYDTHTPFKLSSLTDGTLTNSWFHLHDWLVAANSNVEAMPYMPDRIRRYIYALLDCELAP